MIDVLVHDEVCVSFFCQFMWTLDLVNNGHIGGTSG